MSSDQAEFDALYERARLALLWQTFAVTGDLAAARVGVRDAFISAWHHWRQVSRLDRPEDWIRPHSWAHAARLHSTRPWHRNRDLHPEARATLDALGTLSALQRRMLVLTSLTPGALADQARELGLPQAEAERALQAGTAGFALARGVQTTQVRSALEPLREHIADSSWPAAVQIRRAGTARRRTYTAAGVLATVAAVVVSGFVVTQDATAGPLTRPALIDREQLGAVQIFADPRPVSAVPVVLDAADLLSVNQVERLAPRRSWRQTLTSDNSAGTGTALPCRQDRAADPDGVQMLMRAFETRSKSAGPDLSAVQISELSADKKAAKRAFKAAAGWYSGCLDRRMQLLSSHRVESVGDQADLFVLRSWEPPVTTLTVGIARSGQITTTTLNQAPGVAAPDREAAAALLAAATNSLCGAPGTATCAGPPSATVIPPPAAGVVPGMLSEVDLPPVTKIAKAWVGTEARRTRQNFAASGCAQADFTGKTISNTLTRSFLIPTAKVPTEFGLTQTVGTMPADQARTWVANLRNQIDQCAKKGLGTKVKRLVQRISPQQDLTVWKIDTEISDQRSVRYQMAVLRDGTAISQLGFIDAPDVAMAPGAFGDLAERALERLPRMPRPARPARN